MTLVNEFENEEIAYVVDSHLLIFDIESLCENRWLFGSKIGIPQSSLTYILGDRCSSEHCTLIEGLLF